LFVPCNARREVASHRHMETPLEPSHVMAHGAGDEAHSRIVDAYDTHGQELYAFLLAMTRDVEAAQDIVQEAFLRLVAEERKGRPPSNARAWLYRVAANLAISRTRRRRAAANWSARQRDPQVGGSAEGEVLVREEHQALARALAALGAEARAGLLMAAHGFRGPEIAEALGKSEGATRTLLCRARIRLRDRLEAGMDAR
jgi:RNA polymerase sigma factor (sigma-70 family)